MDKEICEKREMKQYKKKRISQIHSTKNCTKMEQDNADNNRKMKQRDKDYNLRKIEKY